MSQGNGNGVPPGIPDDLVWDAENPPVIFACSQDIEHDKFCTGDCESTVTTENQVLLLNEAKEWARNGLDSNSLQANSFSTQMQVATLQQIIINNGVATLEEIDDLYQKMKYEVMRDQRIAIAEQIKQARMQAMIAQPDKRIIGPNGDVIG